VPIFNEYLLTNQRGSFALGSTDRVPRRKYHSLFTQRGIEGSDPINWISEVIETFDLPERVQLIDIDFGTVSSEEIRKNLHSFLAKPEPTWIYKFSAFTLTRSLKLLPLHEGVAISYKLEWDNSKTPVEFVEMTVRPLMIVRPWHQLHHSNLFLDGRIDYMGHSKWGFKPYAGLRELNLK